VFSYDPSFHLNSININLSQQLSIIKPIRGDNGSIDPSFMLNIAVVFLLLSDPIISFAIVLSLKRAVLPF
ncbi:MAG: hypothetical protein ACFE95_22445, partial [Candidatus Hodarchaeota archaeon]